MVKVVKKKAAKAADKKPKGAKANGRASASVVGKAGAKNPSGKLDLSSPSSTSVVETALAAVVEVKPPEMPTHRLVAEARALVYSAGKDAKQLRTINFDMEKVRLAATLATHLERAQIRMRKSLQKGRTKAEITAEEAATKYRERTLEDIAYVVDDDQVHLKRIADIREGEGVDDLMDDCGVIVDYVLEIAEGLEGIGLVPEQLAEEGRKHIATLQGHVYERRDRTNEASLTPDRDRAATALSAVIHAIRRAGKYVFRDDQRKARNYTSAYTRTRKAVYRAKQTREKTKAQANGRPVAPVS